MDALPISSMLDEGISSLTRDTNSIHWMAVDEMFAEIPWRGRCPYAVWYWANVLASSRTWLGTILPWRTVLNKVLVENLGTEDVVQFLQIVVQRSKLHFFSTKIALDLASIPSFLGAEADSTVGVNLLRESGADLTRYTSHPLGLGCVGAKSDSIEQVSKEVDGFLQFPRAPRGDVSIVRIEDCK